MVEATVGFGCRMNEKTKARLQQHALDTGQTMASLVSSALDEYLPALKKPKAPKTEPRRRRRLRRAE